MRLRWNGQVYDVRLDGKYVTVTPEDGKERTTEVKENSRFPTVAVRDRGGIWVTAAGRTAYLEIARPTGAAGSADEVRSPMTGKIVEVKTSAGKVVAKGDILAVMTAMKMEFRIESPRDGKIKSVDCAEGDLVDLGQVLIRLDELTV